MVRPERFELEAICGREAERRRSPETAAEILSAAKDSFGAEVREGNGAPGEIRTPDLLLRRQSLYPD
jgi:hypothetical protein